uniref:Uncharacterized protein n=1 Tax=Lupinus angustifolius TaxID=3871 RepID=L0P0X5_LUPAN|nr:hypothetical protein [Lupinus angustifolius]
MAATTTTFFNKQLISKQVRNNKWTYIEKSQFFIHRTEFYHQIHFSHLAPICATLKNPKWFEPAPKKKKKTKNLRKDYREDEEQEQETETQAEKDGIVCGDST